MRIACIGMSTVPSRTANSIQLMHACQALADLDHEIAIWVPGRTPVLPPGQLQSHYGLHRNLDVRWIRDLPGLRRYDYAWRALGQASRWGADLFYVWPLQAAALASRRGLPTVMELHDRPPGRGGPALFRRFLAGPGARRLLVTTQALSTYLAATYGDTVKPPFVALAPNGVDLDRYLDLPSASEARRQAGWPEAFTAGYTGHLYEGRGANLMFDMAREMPDIRFVWVGGEDSAVDGWRRRAADLGVANLTLTGFVPQEALPGLQAACDVLLMPYQRRIAVSSGGDTAAFANPMKAFEYLAAGRPILASDLPVIREILHKDWALLLPPGDEHAWIEALRGLRADPARRDALGVAARREAEKYSWRARAERALDWMETPE
jgi:glycosyltransferase involved in cell wall biosynthesis